MTRIYQDPKQVERHGARKAPWLVEWRVNGRRHWQSCPTKAQAKTVAAQKANEVSQRRNGQPSEMRWDEFVAKYDERAVQHMPSVRSRAEVQRILALFGTLIQPQFVGRVSSDDLAEFKSLRLRSRGKKNGSKMSAATVRKELRTIRAALNFAVEELNCMYTCPKVPRVKGLETEKRFVAAEHFDALLAVCDQARFPRGLPCPPADWWRALFAVAWTTGMRIGALLSLRWEDFDAAMGTVVSRAEDNKQKKETAHKLGAAAELLAPLRQLADCRIFVWNHNRRTLDKQFHALQAAAGIWLPCRGLHEHSDCCHRYGFHDFRRAHATYNYGRVPDRALQGQMGHASFATTQAYIRFAEKHKEEAYNAYLPESLRRVVGESATASANGDDSRVRMTSQ